MSEPSEDYLQQLKSMSPADYKRLTEGDWSKSLAAAQERIAELEKGHREYCMGLAEINVSLEAENQRLRERIAELERRLGKGD